MNRIYKLSTTLLVLFCLIALQSHALAVEPSPAIPLCSENQLLAYVPKDDEATSHRRFAPPKISYPFGAQLPAPDDWGFQLTIRVNEVGRVACYDIRGLFNEPLQLIDARRALLVSLPDWSYSPFARDGVPTPAIVKEYIYEEELPRQHLVQPTVPLERVHIILERSGCFGTCPSYRIDLFGDGTAIYEGGGYVDVLGPHRYRIDSQKISQLIDSARSKDLWSLRSEYSSRITDQPTYRITIALGDKSHTISDYSGGKVGMPEAVTEFEKEIDAAAQSNEWIHFGKKALEHLQESHFSCSSREGGEILLRSIADEEASDNQAMLELIKLGAPWSIKSKSASGFLHTPGPALEEALLNQRDAVVDLLIEKGALRDGTTVDQQALDRAFQAAIRGGRLELVQRIWLAAGRQHPSLTYIDVSADEKRKRRPAPVTLLLEHDSDGTKPWGGLEITKWLTAKGCDIGARGADGQTLLHIAAKAGDVKLVRYILDQGVPAATPGRFSLPALGSASDQDVALVLLEAGTDLSKMNDGGTQFRRYALYSHWDRVVAWLDTHQSLKP